MVGVSLTPNTVANSVIILISSWIGKNGRKRNLNSKTREIISHLSAEYVVDNDVLMLIVCHTRSAPPMSQLISSLIYMYKKKTTTTKRPLKTHRMSSALKALDEREMV